MTTMNESRAPQPERLSLETATQLLRLGLAGRRRPVDDLIDRLKERDGATWLGPALDAGPLEGMGSARAMFVEGRADLTRLRAIKERSKTILERPRDREERLAALAGYFLAIAAGLRHHGVIIGGRSRDERNAVLLDLAAVAPAPYCDVLSAAAMVE